MSLRRTLRAVLLCLLLLGGIGSSILWSLYQGFIRFNYPSLADYPVQGVDVSHHQGTIDWSVLRRPEVRFAYIKATEGATFRDPMFATNWREASAAGIVPGAYHFFTLCRSGAEQAANFLATLGDTAAGQLPPAVDLEFGGNCSRRPSKAAFATELRAFLQQVEQALGCRPLLYVTQDFYLPYVAGSFGDYPLWVRNIYREPELAAGARWTLWQFANRGRIDGVGTFIDLNVFAGSAGSFQQLRCGQRAAALDGAKAASLPLDAAALQARDLLRVAVIVANPDYGLAGTTTRAVATLEPQRSADLDRGGLTFRPLAGTALEAQELQTLLKLDTGRVLLRAQASESNLKQLAAPRILHIASHGFFLSGQ